MDGRFRESEERSSMIVLGIGQNIIRMCETYCKHHIKYGIYISFAPLDYGVASDGEIKNYEEELLKACPPLKDAEYHETFDIFLYGSGLLLFDDYESQQSAYWSIVGDDGPTKTNPYDGPMRVYAITINKYGQAENENT